MNTNKETFVVARLLAVGEKLEALLSAKKVPSLADETYFDKCYDAAFTAAPLHEVRVRFMELKKRIVTARNARTMWLAGRDEALAKAKQAAESKRLAIEKSKKLAELRKLRKAAEVTTHQGLKHVTALPKAWQSTEAI